MLQFICCQCGNTLKTSSGSAGEKCRCPVCDGLNTIPSHGVDSPPIAGDGKAYCSKCANSIFQEGEICPHYGFWQKRNAQRTEVSNTCVSLQQRPEEQKKKKLKKINPWLAVVLTVEALMFVGLLVLMLMVYLANPVEIKAEFSYQGKSLMRSWFSTGNVVIYCIAGAILIPARMYYLQHRRK